MKLWKKILPIASAVSAVAVVTPIVTSCGKGVSVLEEQDPTYNYGEVATLNSEVAKQQYSNANNSKNGSDSDIFQRDMIVTISHALSSESVSLIRNLLKKYNVYFDANNLSIDLQNGIELNTKMDISVASLGLGTFKDINVHLEAYFSSKFNFEFVTKANTEKGDYDHTILKLYLDSASTITASGKINGSYKVRQLNDEGELVYKSRTINSSVNLQFGGDVKFENLADYVFNECFAALFNTFNITGGLGFQIACPYFRDVGQITTN